MRAAMRAFARRSFYGRNLCDDRGLQLQAKDQKQKRLLEPQKRNIITGATLTGGPRATFPPWQILLARAGFTVVPV